jgi:hypothetical protein
VRAFVRLIAALRGPERYQPPAPLNLPSRLLKKKKKRQRHVPTCTTVVPHCSPSPVRLSLATAFSSEGAPPAGTAPARRDLLPRGGASPHEAEPARPPLPPPLRVPAEAAQSLAHCHPPSPPQPSAGSRSAVLRRLPGFAKAHVARVCLKCFRCFRGLLQLFHMYVAKVDQDIAYVAMVVYICCKLLFLMFHLFFKRMLHVCLPECCICFTHMLQVFYLNVPYVLQWFSNVFKCFCKYFQMHVSSVSSVFRRMLQLLHPDISKVDSALHMLQCDPPCCCCYCCGATVGHHASA